MKKILAILLSIAILVMALPIGAFAAQPAVATDTWDGTFTEPTETDADGNILINTAEELAWVALRGGEATSGVSYKVADDVESFDLSGLVGVTADSTADEVKSAEKTSNIWRYEADGKGGAFGGNFDGNGVVIYNIYTVGYAYVGLFPCVNNNSTIKNVVVKASSIAGYHHAAGIIGLADSQKVINIEKCIVENCFISDNNDANPATTKAVATFVGGSGNCTVNFNNCLALNNKLETTGILGGFIAQGSAYSPNGISISNSITIGSSAVSTSLGSTALGKDVTERCTWSNVYTDVECDNANVTVLSTDEMQGAAAKKNMILAWNTDWVVGANDEYPTINFGAPIVDPYVWDGQFVEPTETDAEGNVIINTAQEMAWVALRGDAATAGVNYKVADGVEYFDMNGAIGVTVDSTADEVKAAPATSITWSFAADNRVGAFQGNFDGNGVTIYNIRTKSFGYGALFPYVLNDCTIENVTVKASFITGYHYAGGIVGTAEIQSKTVNVNKCKVENCYISDNGDTNPACKRAASGIVGGTGNSNVNVSNCFVASNIISAAGYEAAFIAASGDYVAYNGGISITNSIAIGVTPYSNAKIGSLGNGILTKLTVACVYSDVECDMDGFKTLTTSEMQGAAAKKNMALAWGTDWVVGEEGEYPVIYNGEPIVDPYVWDGNFAEPTETDSEGNIIINTVQEMAWVALRGGDATIGNNYKVADDVKYFDMNGMVGISADSTADAVKSAAKTGMSWSFASDSMNAAPFQGNFDGNGVVVYNISTTKYGYSGLFPVIKPAVGSTITIANVAVAASDIRAYHNAGGIIGLANAPDTSTSFVLENCMVKNCYISDGNDQNAACQRTAGTHVGGMSHNGATINNCVAINNVLEAQGALGGFFANSSNWGGAINVTNSVLVGAKASVTPLLTTTSNHLGSKVLVATFTNVYTDQEDTASGVTVLANDDMIGFKATLKMAELDESIWFFSETSYPELVIFHDIVNGECVDCGLEQATDPCTKGHTLVSVPGVDATAFATGLKAHDKCSVCGKTFIDGVQVNDAELVIPSLADNWDGTFVEPTATDEDGNIIISTAEELAWVALRGGAATAGKNYKVVDNAVFNLNGMDAISAFSSVEDVIAAGQPKADSYSDKYAWRFETDSSAAAPFQGNFDGNGLIVYNLYTGKGRGYGGLFPVITPVSNSSVTIKNVTIASSHIGGYHCTGGIVGYAYAPDTTTKLFVENCVVKNCFIYDNNDMNSACQRTTGILVGNMTHNTTVINNCLVVDNEISASGIIGGLFGNSSDYVGSITVSNVISIGTEVQPMMVDYLISSKVDGAKYINVYTDKFASADGITILDADQMKGAAAAENMNLNWNINWALGAEGEYPSIIIEHDFYDEWDGTFVEPTETDANGNIVINTAEELAWVALRGGEATYGKNYKVADGIKYFNMNGMGGVTLTSSIDFVKEATKNDAFAWRYAADNTDAAFCGNFDGNGVTVYNLYTAAGRGYAGLFPVVKLKPIESLTIKNVAVVASYIGAYHNAGAIIGNADSDDTSSTLVIESCIVKNSYISDNNDANPACQRTAGVIAGNLGHNASTINNCFVMGNEVVAQGIIGGLFGNTSKFAQPSKITNVISIGTSVEPVAVDYEISEKVANITYTNVYTDQATALETVKTLTVNEMTGENALTNAPLDWSAWFATTDLPELRAFHDVTSVDNGDGTHSDSCSDCAVVGLKTEHSYKNGVCVCGAEDETNVNYGDVNGDGRVNGRDYGILLQYLNDWDVTIDSAAADVNGDGRVNGRDYGILLQYLNDWPVVLGPSK